MKRDLLAKEITDSIKQVINISPTLPYPLQYNHIYTQTITELEEMIANAITTAILKYDEIKDK